MKIAFGLENAEFNFTYGATIDVGLQFASERPSFVKYLLIYSRCRPTPLPGLILTKRITLSPEDGKHWTKS